MALAVLVLRSDESPGIEIERGDPPPGIDEVRVHVAGAVARPGVVTVRPGDRVAEAIALAGGFAPGADEAALNLSRRLRDQDRVVVPRAGERSPLLDVNEASAEQLDELPGIGPVRAAAIVASRESGGRFATTDDLVGRGVLPEGVYDGIRDLIAAR